MSKTIKSTLTLLRSRSWQTLHRISGPSRCLNEHMQRLYKREIRSVSFTSLVISLSSEPIDSLYFRYFLEGWKPSILWMSTPLGMCLVFSSSRCHSGPIKMALWYLYRDYGIPVFKEWDIQKAKLPHIKNIVAERTVISVASFLVATEETWSSVWFNHVHWLNIWNHLHICSALNRDSVWQDSVYRCETIKNSAWKNRHLSVIIWGCCLKLATSKVWLFFLA